MVNLYHLLALHHHTGANAQKAHRLIQQYGSVEQAVHELPTIDAWKKDLDLTIKKDVRLISYFDENYPQSFKKLADPPLLLYVKGKGELKELAMAIVGTRQCSSYGLEMAEKFGRELAYQGISIVSGLARGIDTAAHQGALKTGQTIAVLGSGLNVIYPVENKTLAGEITEKGCLISEYPMNTHPEKHYFPKRNRLVSCLSKGVLLIEAPLKSGAMITLEQAEKLGLSCFALPGPIDRDSFRGNHFLIKSHKAHLVENTQDMLSLLKPGTFNPLKKEKTFLLDTEEEHLIKQMPQGEISFEEITLCVNLPVAKLNSLLMRLVLKQVIKEYPGKFYKKVYH